MGKFDIYLFVLIVYNIYLYLYRFLLIRKWINKIRIYLNFVLYLILWNCCLFYFDIGCKYNNIS